MRLSQGTGPAALKGDEGGEGLLAGDVAVALPRGVAPTDVNLDRTGTDPDAELNDPGRGGRPRPSPGCRSFSRCSTAAIVSSMRSTHMACRSAGEGGEGIRRDIGRVFDYGVVDVREPHCSGRGSGRDDALVSADRASLATAGGLGRPRLSRPGRFFRPSESS